MGDQKHVMPAKRDGSSRPPAAETIICWKCNCEIPLSRARDSCPQCGAPLTEQVYDKWAGELLHRMNETGTQIGKTSEQLAIARKRNDKLGPLCNIPLFPSRRLVSRLEQSIEDMRRETQRISSTLKQLAVARYYVSRWYHLTGLPLVDLGIPEARPLEPRDSHSDKEGWFVLLQSNQIPQKSQRASRSKLCRIRDVLRDSAHRRLWHARIRATAGKSLGELRR